MVTNGHIGKHQEKDRRIVNERWSEWDDPEDLSEGSPWDDDEDDVDAMLATEDED